MKLGARISINIYTKYAREVKKKKKIIHIPLFFSLPHSDFIIGPADYTRPSHRFFPEKIQIAKHNKIKSKKKAHLCSFYRCASIAVLVRATR